MSPATTTLGAEGTMLVLGLGLGMVMQVLVIAVQNAVDYKDLGVATSGATLFRLIGGSLGTAVLGAIFAARLEVNLAATLPAGAGGLSSAGIDPQALGRLPAALRAIYAQAFTDSLSAVFVVATAISLAGFLLTWLLPERPLRETVAAAASANGTGELGQTFVMPVNDEVMPRILRGLAAVATRDVQRRFIDGIVQRAGLQLTAAAAWLLVRLDEEPALDPVGLGRAYGVSEERMREAMHELRERNLVIESGPADLPPRRELTPYGCEVLGRLVAARREHLAELVTDGDGARDPELSGLVRGLARELVPDARHGAGAMVELGSDSIDGV